jgi:uncharacterized protein (TIGR02996 family)
VPSLRDALEMALVEDPDDLATHRAYADYLQEQGDPRGEFIQVQLALEERERTSQERRELQRRERELLAEYSREWLGVLADELLGPVNGPWEWLDKSERPYAIRFARGWLERIDQRDTPFEFGRGGNGGRLLCLAPEARLLRELRLRDADAVEQLLRSPFLTNLRVFQFGLWRNRLDIPLSCRALPDFVARLPRLERLYLRAVNYDPAHLFALPNLRSLCLLQVCDLGERYPLEVLAGNPALGTLTRLLLHTFQSWESLIDLAGARAVLQSPYLRSLIHLQVRCSDLGDVGCTEIVTSGILKRLKMLDLRHGEITDAGAVTLATCPELRRLECLDIERNGLTQTGIDALRRVLGPALRADDQQTPQELARGQYLHEGDRGE